MFPMLLQHLYTTARRAGTRPPAAAGDRPAQDFGRPAQADQPRPAGRRRAWRLHVGRARPAARRRPARDRGHLRHVRRRAQRGDARRRARARRAGGGARPAGGLLARGQQQRPSAGPAARRGRPAVFLRAAPGPVVRRAVAVLVAVRSQPAQHQPAQGGHRPLRRLRSHPPRAASRTVHFGDRRPHRRAARVHPRGGHPGSRDGVRLPAGAVSRGRDRRRALLGRRLQRQSGHPALSAHHRDRGRADRPAQSDAAPRGADPHARDHEPHQRNQLQRLAVVRASLGRVHQPVHRRGAAAARHRPRRIPPPAAASSRARRSTARRPRRAIRSTPTSSISRPCTSSASAPRGAFSMRISTASAAAARSTRPTRSRPRCA